MIVSHTTQTKTLHKKTYSNQWLDCAIRIDENVVDVARQLAKHVLEKQIQLQRFERRRFAANLICIRFK
jgi:hypothetical protein